jgi:hypothetical protein
MSSWANDWARKTNNQMSRARVPGGRRGGRKPMCVCGVCALCKQRARSRKSWAKKKAQEAISVTISDEELERRLNHKFEMNGWN